MTTGVSRDDAVKQILAAFRDGYDTIKCLRSERPTWMTDKITEPWIIEIERETLFVLDGLETKNLFDCGTEFTLDKVIYAVAQINYLPEAQDVVQQFKTATVINWSLYEKQFRRRDGTVTLAPDKEVDT